MSVRFPTLQLLTDSPCIELSYLIGPWVMNLIATPQKVSFPPGTAAAFSQSLNTSLELWRVDLPAALTSATDPVLYLAYWHCRLLNYLLMPSALSSDVLWAVKEMFSLLSGHPHVLSPLNHYFTCLAGLVLAELLSVPETRGEATSIASNDFIEASIAPSNWDILVREKVADKLRPTTSSNAEAAATRSLERLADVAAATGNPASKPVEVRTVHKADNYEDMGFDPRPMLRAGYLSSLRPTA